MRLSSPNATRYLCRRDFLLCELARISRLIPDFVPTSIKHFHALMIPHRVASTELLNIFEPRKRQQHVVQKWNYNDLIELWFTWLPSGEAKILIKNAWRSCTTFSKQFSGRWRRTDKNAAESLKLYFSREGRRKAITMKQTERTEVDYSTITFPWGCLHPSLTTRTI